MVRWTWILNLGARLGLLYLWAAHNSLVSETFTGFGSTVGFNYWPLFIGGLICLPHTTLAVTVLLYTGEEKLYWCNPWLVVPLIAAAVDMFTWVLTVVVLKERRVGA